MDDRDALFTIFVAIMCIIGVIASIHVGLGYQFFDRGWLVKQGYAEWVQKDDSKKVVFTWIPVTSNTVQKVEK
jgi:hypothetical protein